MRVCLICIEMFGSGTYGGFGRATRIIGRELVKRNVETIAIVPRRRHGRQEDYTIEGMGVAHFDPMSIKATIDLYRTCDADIYHSQDTMLSTYLAMRAMPDRAHMVTFRDPMDLRDLAIEFKYAKPHRLGLLKAMFYVENPLVRRAIHRADDLNCPAKFLIPKVRKKFNLKSDVYFLPTPVDVSETVRKAEKPTVCFVARWDPRKRPELFFELARQFPDVHFVAVGGSTDKERDTYLRRTHSGIPNLEMTGIIDQFETDRLQKILEKSWALVNTAAREDCGGQAAGTKLFGFREFGCGACCGDHPCAEQLCDLNARAANAAAGSQDQDIFPGSDLHLVYQHIPGGQKNQRDSRSFFEAQAWRNRKGILRRRLDELGVSTLRALTENPVAAAQIVIAGKAMRTGMARAPAGCRQHFVTNFNVVYQRTTCNHHTRGVCAQNVRHFQFQARPALTEPQIEMV